MLKDASSVMEGPSFNNLSNSTTGFLAALTKKTLQNGIGTKGEETLDLQKQQPYFSGFDITGVNMAKLNPVNLVFRAILDQSEKPFVTKKE